MFDDYLKELEEMVELDLLSEKELIFWEDLNELMEDLKAQSSPEMFALESRFDDPDYSPKSAHMGYLIGIEIFTTELFERILASRVAEIKPTILH